MARGIKNTPEVIYERVLPRSNGCWESVRDYWKVRLNGRQELAHRVSYCLEHGLDISDIRGKVVMHTCDNPKCLNPDHLLLGATLDNVRDKIRKGRARYKSVRKYSKESIHGAMSDVGSGMSQRAAAKKHGMSQQYLSMLINGIFTRTDLA